MNKFDYASVLLPVIKKHTEMEVKFFTVFLYFLGIPGWLFTLYINLGTWKSDIMFAVSLLLMGFHAYWKWKKNVRADRKAEQEERLREIEMRERENDFKKIK